jgi:hypothetical protein
VQGSQDDEHLGKKSDVLFMMTLLDSSKCVLLQKAPPEFGALLFLLCKFFRIVNFKEKGSE